MRVVERGQLECLVETLDFTFDLGGFSLDFALLDRSKFVAEGFGLSEHGKRPGEVGSLLRSGLGGGRVRGGGAIPNCKDFRSAEDSHVVVDGKTSSVLLVLGQVTHELSRDTTGRVSGRPNEETIGNLSDFLVGVLHLDRLFRHVLDHGSGQDINLVFLESGFSVLDQLLGKGGKDVGESFDQGDLELVGDFGVPSLQVVNQEIVQFSGVFDTGGTTTDDDHVHESLLFFFRLTSKGRSLDTVQESSPDFISVLEFLEETSVLGYTFHSKCLTLGSNGVDEVVV